MQVRVELNQFVSMVVAPGGVSDYGAQTYRLVSGMVDRDERDCRDGCLFSGDLLGRGDHAGIEATAPHQAAIAARAQRAKRQGEPARRLARWLEEALERARR